MRKATFIALLFGLFISSGFASTPEKNINRVEEATNYRIVNKSFTNEFYSRDYTIRNFEYTEPLQILFTDTQLDELGITLQLSKSNSQLNELGTTLQLSKSNSQLNELGTTLQLSK